MSTLYDELGVAPTAPAEVIRAAYKALIRATHPDQGGDPEVAARVNAAYEVLGDVAARARYDADLRQIPSPAETAAATAAAPPPSTPDAAVPATPPTPRSRARRSSIPWVVIGAVWSAGTVWAVAGAIADSAAGVGPLPTEAYAPTVLAAGIAGTWLMTTRWWWAGIIVALAAAVFDPIYAGVMLSVGVAVRVVRARDRARRGAQRMEAFWAACDEESVLPWHVDAAMIDRGTTLAQLSDPLQNGRHPVSMHLWGSIPAGTFVAVDMTAQPGVVRATATAADDRAYDRALRRSR